MSSKTVFIICVLVTVAVVSAQGGPGAWGAPGIGPNAGIPPWVAAAPWYPKWVPCTVIGSSCLDCNTKLVCTKVGGLQRACTDPTLPYCNLGECSATPAAGCEPAPSVPANVAA